jgi:hypothetical protein
MAGNPNGLHSLAKYTKLPIERIRYVPDADEGILNDISRGILFLMAFWSGTSVKGFATLTQVVATLDQEKALELVVIDVDGSPALYHIPEFLGNVHGNGETAWVRNGSVIATSGLGLNVECFVPNTKLLLESP